LSQQAWHVIEPFLLKAISAKHGQNLQPFVGNVDVPKQVKDSQR
jgi:hypothetical protein